MELINIEIKARVKDLEQLNKKLLDLKADFKGLDRQIDTYFRVNHGRLKQREGSIEKSLIFYERPEVDDLKRSAVLLKKMTEEDGILSRQLEAALGIKVVVDKERRIYFIDNVKFHLDEVKNLGSFAEIEAIGQPGQEEELSRQCRYYMKVLGIVKKDLIDKSYSDMIIKAEK